MHQLNSKKVHPETLVAQYWMTGVSFLVVEKKRTNRNQWFGKYRILKPEKILNCCVSMKKPRHCVVNQVGFTKPEKSFLFPLTKKKKKYCFRFLYSLWGSAEFYQQI